MKLNKKYILLRIITSPIKLIFTLIWMILWSTILVWKWILYGSDEVYFSENFNRNDMSKLIESVEKLNKKDYENTRTKIKKRSDYC